MSFKKDIKDLQKQVDKNPADAETVKALVALVVKLAEKVDGLDEDIEEIVEAIDEMYEDLEDIEAAVFGEDALAEDDHEFVELTCPACKKPVLVDYETLHDEGAIPCPHCKGALIQKDM